METWVIILSVLFYIFAMVNIVMFFKGGREGEPFDKGTEYMVNFIFWFTLSLIGAVIVITA